MLKYNLIEANSKGFTIKNFILFIKSSLLYFFPLFTYMIVLHCFSSIINKYNDVNTIMILNFACKLVTILLFLLIWFIYTKIFRMDSGINSNKNRISLLILLELVLFKLVVYLFGNWLLFTVIFKQSVKNENSLTLNVGGKVISFISVVILAPLLEELLFRAHILGVPKKPSESGYHDIFKILNMILGFIFSIFGFALIHFAYDDFNVARFISLLISGVLYALVYYKTNCLQYPLFMHIATNFVNTVFHNFLFVNMLKYLPIIATIMFLIILSIERLRVNKLKGK